MFEIEQNENLLKNYVSSASNTLSLQFRVIYIQFELQREIEKKIRTNVQMLRRNWIKSKLTKFYGHFCAKFVRIIFW